MPLVLEQLLLHGVQFTAPSLQVADDHEAGVAAVSDLSAAELETAFTRGLNTRGRFEPWAVVLDRHLAWQAGFRPVMYVDAEREWGFCFDPPPPLI
ncbi:hypothetical protein [Amycolatopsis sp. lyj-90]|uniref:hypothetical protein n=1 Tax=Amycolatopsis sp. lyj-90 TaxID=2789285 RepID=UPI0039799994